METRSQQSCAHTHTTMQCHKPTEWHAQLHGNTDAMKHTRTPIQEQVTTTSAPAAQGGSTFGLTFILD